MLSIRRHVYGASASLTIAALLTACATSKRAEEVMPQPPVSSSVQPAKEEYAAVGHYTFRYISGKTLDKGTKAKLVWYPESKTLEYGFVDPNNSQYNRYTCTDRGRNLLQEQLNPDGSKSDISDYGATCRVTYGPDGMPSKMISFLNATEDSCPAGAECQLISVTSPWEKKQGDTTPTAEDLDSAKQSREEYKLKEDMEKARESEIERQTRYNRHEAFKECERNPHALFCDRR